MSHKHLPENYCYDITSTLMWPGVRCEAFNVVVVAFFLDISQFSVVSSLSSAYPSKHDCLLPSTWWVVGLYASTLLVEVESLLRQRHLLIMTWPLPWPNIYLPLFVLIYPRTIWHPRARPTTQYPYLGLSSLQYIYIYIYIYNEKPLYIL